MSSFIVIYVLRIVILTILQDASRVILSNYLYNQLAVYEAWILLFFFFGSCIMLHLTG